MISNEKKTFLGLCNGSNPNLLSATVMKKISKITTKPPVQCHIENYKNPENSCKIQPSISFRFDFFSSPFQLVRRLLRMEDIALLEAMTPRRAVML